MARVILDIDKETLMNDKFKPSWLSKKLNNIVLKNSKVLKEVNITILLSYEEAELAFNDYIVSKLDLDLHAYDEFIPQTDYNGITYDFSELEEDCPFEFNTIMDALTDHFGNNIFIDTDYKLDATVAFKRMFPNALIEESNGNVAITATPFEILGM